MIARLPNCAMVPRVETRIPTRLPAPSSLGVSQGPVYIPNWIRTAHMFMFIIIRPGEDCRCFWTSRFLHLGCSHSSAQLCYLRHLYRENEDSRGMWCSPDPVSFLAFGVRDWVSLTGIFFFFFVCLAWIWLSSLLICTSDWIKQKWPNQIAISFITWFNLQGKRLACS